MPKKAPVNLTDTRIQRAPVRRYPELYPKGSPAGRPAPPQGRGALHVLPVGQQGQRVRGEDHGPGHHDAGLRIRRSDRRAGLDAPWDWLPPRLPPPEGKEAQKKYRALWK